MKIDAKHGSRRQLAGRRRITRTRPSVHRPLVTLDIFPVEQTFPLPCSSEVLIANARLEFRASHSKQRTGAKSNRERMSISCQSFSAFSGFEHQASSLQNLIVTTRLEFRATRTKQTSSSISNRYKMHFSRRPQSHPCLRVLAATRRPRYNSGSHIEVNQP
jgi:hypothetical protein